MQASETTASAGKIRRMRRSQNAASRNCPPFEIAQDECRYQIARDDEEDIDAQIAAVEAELRVKQNDSEDRNSAKAVDL